TRPRSSRRGAASAENRRPLARWSCRRRRPNSGLDECSRALRAPSRLLGPEAYRLGGPAQSLGEAGLLGHRGGALPKGPRRGGIPITEGPLGIVGPGRRTGRDRDRRGQPQGPGTVVGVGRYAVGRVSLRSAREHVRTLPDGLEVVY